MNRLGLTIGFVFMVPSACCPSLNAQMVGYNRQDPGTDNAIDVSILQLIATPERFNGKKIRVIGFLRLEFEGNALYLHKEDFERSISKNGVWIDTPRDLAVAQKEVINNKYVICEGVFKSADHGHMGMFGGAIGAITRLEVWSFERSH